MRLLAVCLLALALAVPSPVNAAQSERDIFTRFDNELGGLQVGGLYSINIGESSFRVGKVLALNRYAVHVRVYANHYWPRPTDVDPATLDIGGPGHPLGIGIGHVPLSWDLFAAWQPQFMRLTDVAEDELDGLREWQRARGGVFDGPGGRAAILRVLTIGLSR